LSSSGPVKQGFSLLNLYSFTDILSAGIFSTDLPGSSINLLPVSLCTCYSRFTVIHSSPSLFLDHYKDCSSLFMETLSQTLKLNSDHNCPQLSNNTVPALPYH